MPKIQVSELDKLEITMKAFCIDEGVRNGVKPNSIVQRIKRGKYPNLIKNAINKRVVFVTRNLEITEKFQTGKNRFGEPYRHEL